MTILDYYKYATLATASYVRMGDTSLSGQNFATLAGSDAQQRLPLALVTCPL